jgi:hypothetical protein
MSFEKLKCYFHCNDLSQNVVSILEKELKKANLLNLFSKRILSIDNRPKLDTEDKLISSHDSKNPYDVFKNINKNNKNKKYVRMFIEENVFVFFDYDDLSKITPFSWSLVNDHVQTHINNELVYMHHIITGYTGVFYKNLNNLDNRKCNLYLKNSYKILEDDNGKYIEMHIKDDIYTTFDYEDIEKILGNDITKIKNIKNTENTKITKNNKAKNNNAEKISWFISNGYIKGKFNLKVQKYMHHVIMDFKSSGKGFQKEIIDHIDKNPLNNRKYNLRKIPKERKNTNKRIRNKKAIELPDKLTQEDIPKYIIYYREKTNSEKFPYRDFFRIEKHPAQNNGIFKNRWSTSKSTKIPIRTKLEEAKKKLEELELSIC